MKHVYIQPEPWLEMGITEAEYFKQRYLEMGQDAESLQSQLTDLRKQYEQMRAGYDVFAGLFLRVFGGPGANPFLKARRVVSAEEMNILVKLAEDARAKYSSQPSHAVKEGEKPPVSTL